MRLIADNAPFIFPKKLASELSYDFEIDLAKKTLERARSFGHKEVLMPPLQMGSSFFSKMNQVVLEEDLIPIHYLSVSDFCLNRELESYLEKGVNFAIMIYEPLPSAFLDQLKQKEEFKDQLHYVFLCRNDWNIENTYKSLPYSIREKLYVDFPVKLHENDPFFTPEEVELVVKKIKQNFKNVKIKSFAPNYQFYNEFLQSGVQSVVESKRVKGESPVLSVITNNPQTLEFLNATICEEANNVEIVVPRFSDSATKVVPKIENILVTKVWLHKFGQDDEKSELTYCMNEGALKAQGQYLVFVDEVTESNKQKIKEILMSKEIEECEFLVKSDCLIFKRDSFLKLGGFDPLYGSFDPSGLEMIYRYLVSESKETLFNVDLIKNKLSSLEPLNREVFSRLFYGQYEDLNIYKTMSLRSLEDLISSKEESFGFLSLEAKYRFERIKDAYLSLYKATPKVALEGNLKFLWSFISPALIKIYFILHGFYYKVLHRMYHLVTWTIKKVFYKTLHPAYHGVTWAMKRVFYKTIHPAYHGLTWTAKKIFYKTLHPFYYKVLHKGYYRCHTFYYEYVFKALYPVRKVYYFIEYQYEKRVLGLHKRREMD